MKIQEIIVVRVEKLNDMSIEQVFAALGEETTWLSNLIIVHDDKKAQIIKSRIILLTETGKSFDCRFIPSVVSEYFLAQNQ